jgi:choline dehydrogenase-like flavoprotein
MLFDFNEAWSRVTERQYDVCICGTGPAGITTARKLAAYGKNVLLLEGGGLSYSDESQDHYRGVNVGRNFWLETSRLRYFGGTSNHWSGLCALLEPITFGPHNYLGLPGWPISYQEVLSRIDEAREILDIVGKDLTPSKQPGFPSPWFDRFVGAISAPTPTRFGEKYGPEIRASERIDAFNNANVVDLKLSNDLSRVQHIQVQNYNSVRSEVSAARYVLALGAIENARTLLNANGQIPTGIGNHSGMVGRCFMEHLNVTLGRFLPTDPEFWKVDSISLVPTEEFMRREDIGSGAVDFDPHVSAFALRHGGRLGPLKDFVQETGCFSPALMALARQIVDFDCPGDGWIRTLIEQQPNPDSRVSLANSVDTFGLRRVQMNWQLSERDLRTIRTLAIETAKEMARLNRARVQLAPYILDPSLEIPCDTHAHHMGTTRMSADPRYGVVDENCKVHEIQNLYIAGSSVYSTGGGRNPTLTIVLLALRLADFLNHIT